MEGNLLEGDFIPECFEDMMDEDLEFDVEDRLWYDSPIKQPVAGRLTDELYYNSDFRDNWFVKIKDSFGGTNQVVGYRRKEKDEQPQFTVTNRLFLSWP